MNEAPIFWALVNEYRQAGRPVKWYYTVKPKGTVSIVPATTQGIHPVYVRNYYRAGTHPLRTFSDQDFSWENVICTGSATEEA